MTKWSKMREGLETYGTEDRLWSEWEVYVTDALIKLIKKFEWEDYIKEEVVDKDSDT